MLYESRNMFTRLHVGGLVWLTVNLCLIFFLCVYPESHFGTSLLILFVSVCLSATTVSWFGYKHPVVGILSLVDFLFILVFLITSVVSGQSKAMILLDYTEIEMTVVWAIMFTNMMLLFSIACLNGSILIQNSIRRKVE